MRWIPAAAVSALGLCGIAYADGLRFNHTDSMPVGIWRTVNSPGSYRVGDVVLVCPSLTDRQKVYLDPGNCPSKMEPMLKPVAAAAGDVVTVSDAGIAVNGRGLPGSAPMPVDGVGRPLQAYPAGTYQVAPGQVWLLTAMPASFDSRYLGPVPINAIQGRASPVLVW